MNSYVAADQNQLGHVAFRHRDFATARALHLKSLRIRRQVGAAWEVAMSLRSLGQVAFAEGDLDAAWKHTEETISILADQGDDSEIAESLLLLGQIACYQGEYGHARRLYQGAPARAQKSQNWMGRFKALTKLGHVTRLEGDPGRAWQQLIQGLSILQEVGSLRGLADNFEELAGVSIDCGDIDSALFYLSAASAVRESRQEPKSILDEARVERVLASVQRRIDFPYRSPSWLEARAMSLEQVIDQALQQDPPCA